MPPPAWRPRDGSAGPVCFENDLEIIRQSFAGEQKGCMPLEDVAPTM